MRAGACVLLALIWSTQPVAAAPQRTARSQVQRLVDQLDLTADQKGKLDPILEEDATQVRALRTDTALSDSDRRKKTAEIRSATDAKIKPILTAEQWKKLEQLRDERKQQKKQKK
jgi:Spy/CpxP family protein refolding chaperone